jgi:hypothetical protein
LKPRRRTSEVVAKISTDKFLQNNKRVIARELGLSSEEKKNIQMDFA